MAAATDTKGLVDPIEFGFQFAYAEELRSYFRSYAATVGFRSTFSAMLAALAGVALGTGPRANWDPYAEVVDRISEGATVHRTLRRMTESGESRHVDVLTMLYGGRAEGDWYADLGELAPLARLTVAAAESREQIVAREGERREVQSTDALERKQSAVRDELAHDFWRAAAAREALFGRHTRMVDRLDRLQARENAGEDLSPKSRRTLADGDARLRDLALRIAAHDELMAKLLDAYLYDGRLRAKLGALTATDREITAADAIRRMLARKRSDAVRTVFVAEVKREASAMRKAAHAAYKRARKAL